MKGLCSRFFDEETRRSVVQAVESGMMSVHDAEARYGILGHSTVLKWLRRYGGGDYPMSRKVRGRPSTSADEQKLRLLSNQVKVLERELREARLKQAALETLIDVAEEHYSISIKKNSGGKQSTK